MATSIHVSSLMRQYGVTGATPVADWADAVLAQQRDAQGQPDMTLLTFTPMHFAGLLHCYAEAQIAQRIADGKLAEIGGTAVLVQLPQAMTYALGLAYLACMTEDEISRRAESMHKRLVHAINGAQEQGAEFVTLTPNAHGMAVEGLQLLVTMSQTMGVTAPPDTDDDEPPSWAALAGADLAAHEAG